MTEKEIAQALIPLVGGRENIISVMHCATRLRIVVSDKDKIQVKEVENRDRVKGSLFNAGQYQITFGTGLVNRVYEAVMNELGLQPEAAVDDKPAKPVTGNRFQRAIRMFSDVFVPIIPVLVATGLFMGLRGLLTQEAVLGVFGMTPDDIPQQLLLFTQILTDTAFAFLPALVCWSTFKNFGGSPVIGIVLGLMLVSNSLPSAYDVGSGVAEPLIFFGFIPVAGYQGSVLPAFATGVLAAKFEKFLRKHVPDAIDLIVTPFLTLLVGILMAMFVLGPILHMVENGVLFVVEGLLTLPMGIGGLIYGSFGQLLGIFGIHHMLCSGAAVLAHRRSLDQLAQICFSVHQRLQTQFFEYMRQAGFTDFERGVQGSDAEHLEVLEYKVQKDRQTVAELSDQTKQLQGQRKELISQVKNISGSIRDVADIEQRAKAKGVLEKRNGKEQGIIKNF